MPKILIEITEKDFNFLKRQVSLGWSQPIEQIIVEKGTILEDCNPEDCIRRSDVERLTYRYLNETTDNHVAFYEHLLDLPSVYPKSDKTADAKPIVIDKIKDVCSCPHCGKYLFEEEWMYLHTHDKYCPYCGEKIIV